MKSRKPKYLYFKMFWTYVAIVFCIVAALVIYFISVSRNRLLESNERDIERICAESCGYIEEASEVADSIHKNLYRSGAELEDLLAYFELEPEEYQRYSLDRYAASDELVYKGIFSFINESFEVYRRLEKVELISYSTFDLTECFPDKSVYPGKNGRPRLALMEHNALSEDGKLVYQKEVRNPLTMESTGCILFTFEGESALRKIQNSNSDAGMIILCGDDVVVYQEPEKEAAELFREKEQYLICKELAGEYQIYTYMDRRSAARMPLPRLLAILAAGVLAVVIGIISIDYYVKRLTGRVDAILGAMNQVTTGDFKVRLTTRKKEDELDMIAGNFNDMCEKLELYIEKSYLEEIERKNAQMQALQSQINPHFLYNTLEAIRMKAICNGDREVGKMLYSMVVLFRSQLKEADVITLGQEMDYCKQYMELFEYRYQGTFHSEVECPAELLELPIIKFVLQPIVENYFVHGIQRDRNDNMVQIRAERKGDTLYLYVRDNGCGMEPEKLAQKNRELKENRKPEDKKESIGIFNVNRRIKAVYGEQYGIYMEAVKTGGLQVVLTIKTEGESYENGDVG